MRALSRVPQQPLKVAQFKTVKDAKGTKVPVIEHLNSVVKSLLEKHNPESWVVAQWKEFRDNFPRSTADEYIKQAGNTYHVPFPSLWRPEEGPYREGQAAKWNQNTNRNLYVVETMLRANSTASVQWGPQMNEKGGNSGFPSTGAIICEHPRVFPDFKEQGLTGPYLVTGDPSKYKSTAYENKSAKELKDEVRRRKLKPMPKNKKECIERLKADDVAKAVQLTNEPEPAPEDPDEDSEYEIDVGKKYEEEVEDEDEINEHGNKEAAKQCNLDTVSDVSVTANKPKLSGSCTVSGNKRQRLKGGKKE
jgi:hypothetical protein